LKFIESANRNSREKNSISAWQKKKSSINWHTTRLIARCKKIKIIYLFLLQLLKLALSCQNFKENIPPTKGFQKSYFFFTHYSFYSIYSLADLISSIDEQRFPKLLLNSATDNTQNEE